MHDNLAIDPASRPRTPPSLSRGYIALWVGLASASLVYMATLTTRPDIVASYLPEPRTEAASASNNADVATMRSTIAQLNAELAEAKSAARASDARIAMLTQRVEELEPRTPAIPVAAAEPAPPLPQAQPQVSEPPASAIARKFADSRMAEAKPVEVVKPVVKPVTVAHTGTKTPPPATPAEAATAMGLETGSIAAPPSAVAAPPAAALDSAPVTFGPAVVKPAAQTFGLELGRASSPEALRITWGILTEQNGAVLKGLSPNYAQLSDAADAPLTLIAGPLKSKTEAVRVCKALQARSINCKVGAFTGEAL